MDDPKLKEFQKGLRLQEFLINDPDMPGINFKAVLWLPEGQAAVHLCRYDRVRVIYSDVQQDNYAKPACVSFTIREIKVVNGDKAEGIHEVVKEKK